MDTGDSRSELRYSDGEHTFRHVTERSLDINQQRSRDGDCWRLVDVLLSGGAPWGFTLRGGREHREPLLITKVEEGSKAAGVSLQVGDELVNINEIPLSGYRQEAICLVKGSHKTLTLVVKRNMKMVDIVAQKMPSENDVHVARSFLTKILRSSMRKNRFKGRNEPASRPHSWHSTKFNESQSETAKTQTPPTTVWHTKYDASSSSTDLSSGWDQTNLRRVSDQFSSLGSMDSLDHVPHSYPPGRLSPAKSHNNSVELIGGGGGGVGGGGGGKRDSAYSSFSTSSGTPDYTLSKSNAASTENMLYKVNQWDAGGRQASNGRHSQSLSEGLKGEERGPGYLQLPGGGSGRDSPRTEEQPGSRQSSSSRASFGPVWHVPEKKKTASPSPPPPAPPVRSDSFAATKVHEKGLIIAYPEATDPHGQPKPPGKGPDKGSEPSDGSKRSHDGRRGPHSNPPAKNDGVNHPHVSADNHGHNQLTSNTPFSGSSTDVRPGQPPPYSYQPYHQRQYSNESALLAPPGRAPSAAKPQSVGGYYSSLQELPTSTSAQFYSPSQGRTPSVSSLSVEQNPEGSGGAQNRYYCVTARQAGQHSSQAAVVKADERKAPAVPTATADISVDKRSLSPPRYTPPQQQQQPHSTAKENNGYKHSPTVPHSGLESLAAKPVPDDRDRQRGNGGQHPATYYTSYPPSQSEQRRSLPQQQREIPPSLRQQEAGKICPQSTPMLHSLSKETLSVQGPPPREPDLQPEGYDPLGTKQTKRSERFATTLRNEIAVRRAKLQKSQSAATLCGPEDEEEEATRAEAPAERDTRRHPEGSPADNSFTSIYKDHLKEAQARVLKATSFRRRDLEPVLLEHGGVDASPGWEAPSGRGRNAALPSLLNETPRAGSAAAGGQVTRIGGRKRFATEKKVRSYSEPDKIHEVGVEEDAPPSEGSLHNRRMIFENTGKTAFTKAYPKLSTHSCSEDPREGKSRAAAPTDDGHRGLRSRAAPSTQEAQGSPYSSHRQALLEQQRLGTFAEYEATWSSQKKPLETRGSGQYRSADNILDQGGEEPAAPVCVHERSRSSPSADFYGQKISAPGRKSADYYQPETKPAEQDITATRFSDRGHGNYRATDKSTEFEVFPEPPPPPVTGDDAESRATAPGPGGPVYHPGTSISPSPVTHPVPPPHPEDQAPSQHPSGGWRKTAPPYRPPTARLDKPRRPEVPSTPSDVHEAQSGPRGGASQMTELNPALAPPGHHRRLLDGGNGASPPATVSNHPPAPPLSQPLPPPPSPPLPSPPPVAVATSPGGASVLADSAGSMQRSPSPQFAPQRLTDKPPPVSLQDVEPSRMENVTENNLSVKKVPIKIVHAESVTEKESRQYLLHSDPGAAGLGGDQQVASLGSPEKEPAYSLFCAYTRQREPGTEREPELRDHQDPGGMNPLGNPSSEGPPSIQALPPMAPEPTEPKEPPGSNGEGAGPAGPTEPEHPEEEEKKREELARDIMGKDRALADILDESKRKTTMDLMEGIFPQGEQVLEGASQRKKVAPKHTSPRAPEERNDEESPAVITLVTSSTYYSTSVPKAELLIKMKDMQEQEPEEQDSEEELDIDLANKKQELIDSLSKKLQVLREARESLQEDVLDNNALGQEVEASVQQVCKPNQLDKFRMFVGDLDKVVSLLLSLSGRLARVENALNSLDEDASPEERRTLTEKRKLLIRQHEDAKELKENLDRRERVVYDVLASCLPEESMEDYEHFVKMKSALIIEQRKLEDKIKLGEEQLKCLTDSLPLDQRPLL